MKLPNYSLLTSQLINIGTMLGGAVAAMATMSPGILPLLPTFIPDPHTRATITGIFGIAAAIANSLNHRVAGVSFPDGQPVTTKTSTATVEIHQDIPQTPAEAPAATTVTAKETNK